MSTYLRSQQIQELHSERQALRDMLGDSAAQVQDRGVMNTQIRSIDQQIDRHAPPEVMPGELDALVQEEKHLRAELLEGMPSAEEMRKAPAGAVGKHQIWDKRAKQVINEAGDKRLDRWKNIQMRLNRGNEDPDICNFERYRPKTSTLPMHDTFIQDSATRSFPSPQFTRNYERMEMESSSSQEQVDALQAEIADLREQVKNQGTGEVTKPKKKAASAGKSNGQRVEVEAPCGRVLTPSVGREKTSLMMHKRACEKCQGLDAVSESAA